MNERNNDLLFCAGVNANSCVCHLMRLMVDVCKYIYSFIFFFMPMFLEVISCALLYLCKVLSVAFKEALSYRFYSCENKAIFDLI